METKSHRQTTKNSRATDSSFSVVKLEMFYQSINRASKTTTKLQQIFTCWTELDSGTDPNKAKNQFTDAVKSEVTVATNSGERRFWELYTAPLS